MDWNHPSEKKTCRWNLKDRKSASIFFLGTWKTLQWKPLPQTVLKDPQLSKGNRPFCCACKGTHDGWIHKILVNAPSPCRFYVLMFYLFTNALQFCDARSLYTLYLLVLSIPSIFEKHYADSDTLSWSWYDIPFKCIYIILYMI